MPLRIRCASRSSKPLCAASLGILLFGFASRPGAARADAPGGDPRRGERRVVVLDAGSEAVDADLADVLAELLARLHLNLVRRGSPNVAPVVARVAIESSERGAVVTIAGGRESTPVRREVERGDSPAVFRETVAHVILGAVEPLASSDQEPSPPPVSAPVDALVPAATRASEAVERRAVWSLGGRAGPRVLAADRASIGFGGFAGLTLPMALHPSAGLHAGYVLPARLSRDSVDAVFGLVPLRLQAGIEPLAAKSVALDVALALGVDIVWLIPEAGPPQSQLGPSTTRVQPMIGAASSARFRLTPKADLVVTLGVDLDAAPRRWVIAAGPEHNPLFEMSRFRPYAAVGFDWMLGGSTSPEPSESLP
jgi:hypothetical protein